MTSTVKVACKLPAGLIVDHVTKDGREGKLQLNGASHPSNVAGFGVTEVDADLFRSWLGSEEGKTFAPVKNGLIFEISDKDRANDKVKERSKDKTVATGAEPIDPTKPAPGVAPTDEQKAELAKLPEEPGGQTVVA